MYNILRFASNIIKQVLEGEEVNLKGFHRLQIDGLTRKMDVTAEKYKYFLDIAEARFKQYHTVSDITIITDDIAIVEVTDKGNLYGYFYIVNGQASSEYSTDKESAILNAIGKKYDGNNSQFSYYACKMLGKEIK